MSPLNAAVPKLAAPPRGGAGKPVSESERRLTTESEHGWLAQIVHSANDAIVSRLLDGTIISWNAAAERLYGWSAAEVIGRQAAEFLPPGERYRVDANNECLRRGELIVPFETRHVTRDGRAIDTFVCVSPLHDSSGRLVGSATIARDITEVASARRRLEHQTALGRLMESLARAINDAPSPEHALRACLAQICAHGGWLLGHAGTFEKGQKGGVPRLSIWHCAQPEPFDGFMRLSDSVGYSVEHGIFVGAALREKRPVWVPDFAAAPRSDRIDRAGAARIRSGFAFPVVVASEAAAFFEFFADEVRAPDQLFLDAVATIGSQLARVIERQRALEEARISEQRLAGILGTLHEVVYSMDAGSGRILFLNAAARRLARRPLGDFLADAKLWRRMIHADDRALVRRGVRALLETGTLAQEFRVVLGDGEVRTVENRSSLVRDATGAPLRIDGTLSDITERRQAEERSAFLAQYDTVTGLPNRSLFADRLGLAIARGKRVGTMTALLLLDLDRFKQINEALGHAAGDETLRQVTARLRERLRQVDTLARLGGDEFAVILEGVEESAQALCVADKVVEAMAEPLSLNGEDVFVTFSAGVALHPSHGESADQLIEYAEQAMYQAKRDGRNAAHLYSSTPAKPGRRGLGMESRLRRALERNELHLHFQPKVDIGTGAISGVEALLRWRNPDLGTVPPAAFIPLAEETGLIEPIGEWVLHLACAQASAWAGQGCPVSVAVNLSGRQFRNKNLFGIIEKALADSGLDAGRLELEITESMVMHRPDQAVATLQRLHDIGVMLSVDDFGTGYSSLAYLKRFPVHKLKIDRSFVQELGKSGDDAAIVRAVIALARSLALRTVAEGVETEQQLAHLAELKCDEYQGYFFSKPLGPADLLALLQRAAHKEPRPYCA